MAAGLLEHQFLVTTKGSDPMKVGTYKMKVEIPHIIA